MKNEFYLVRKEILPDNVENILKARELIENDGYSITDACEKAGISRSTYYKYKNDIYQMDNRESKKMIITFKVDDVPGVLNSILAFLFSAGVNVLTINQNMPVSNTAFILLTLDIKDMKMTSEELVSNTVKLSHVRKAEIIAYE